MRRLVVAAAAFGVLAGCNVGEGSGHASGELYVLGCKNSGDLGSREAPAPYDLKPRFFAGDPINDPVRMSTTTERDNGLIVRLQPSGTRPELNDLLLFNFPNLWEAARCVRGRLMMTDAGPVPDYDVRNCHWPTGGGLPRLRVSPDAWVTADLIPRVTCTKNVVLTAVAAARPENDGRWESWIEFEDFGSALMLDVPPSERPAVARNFKIAFGERVHARMFVLSLEDDQVIEAARRNDPIPPPEAGGRVQGFFDFDLERGLGAQTFP